MRSLNGSSIGFQVEILQLECHCLQIVNKICRSAYQCCASPRVKLPLKIVKKKKETKMLCRFDKQILEG
jgi:hypothetical protein